MITNYIAWFIIDNNNLRSVISILHSYKWAMYVYIRILDNKNVLQFN